MKNIFYICLLVISANILWAEDLTVPKQENTKENLGNINNENKPKNVEIISLNGAVTRAKCPYTCEMRGLPIEHCKTWPSTSDASLCYIWDTRLPQDAVRVGK